MTGTTNVECALHVAGFVVGLKVFTYLHTYRSQPVNVK